MMKQQEIRVFGLSHDVINQLQLMALERYGKASASLMLRKLAEKQIRQPENIPTENYQENKQNQRLTLRLPPQQQHYLNQKAQLQYSSLNDVVRDIIAEYITQNPVLSNDEVQALYQSNYQLLRLGRNINQIARQLNSITPTSLTSQQLTELSAFLKQHAETVGKVLRKQNKPFKYRPIENIQNETDR
ncbi:plasmid mobilization relaxosome protein MobC [Kingella negevensis]|uniref:plasmid mobilization relaxosome protein MobC n=2 Tax=Kingella negevensis TaxID=1522312 RepID=UPI00254D42E4|nr:plasmid mobilization relaxosome protein MobC [Kingella negevensis]MDK4680031.1 plasmid mobilization relaxosome protein MobC [Kingella negevensis]MDK4682249.1 plasmid mobilization relaxosome protein MobC [Kingella negevensis]MDK4690446.1 plasmid mobilization relaxosome protein MobC [Kingella negevensis]